MVSTTKPAGGAGAILFGVASVLAACPAYAACDDLLPAAAGAGGMVTARDLLRLRDIGSPEGSKSDAPLAVSPDGRSVAFVLSRADPDTNRYCRALLLVGTEAPHRVRLLDRGGDYIPVESVVRGLFVTIGTPKAVTPAWSPDGRRIAYLRRDAGVTQIWVASLEPGTARQVSHFPVEVESVAWSRDGRRLLYTARPARLTGEAAIAHEGRSGWLYDDRVATNQGPRPQVRAAEAPLETLAIDPEGGAPVALDDEDDAAPARDVTSAAGYRAGIEPVSRDLLADNRLRVLAPDGRRVACAAAACTGRLAGPWWDRTGQVLTFLRREGWAQGRTGLYRWRVGIGQPVRTLSTQDRIRGCAPLGDGLVCTRESSTSPRTIVRLDPATGAMQNLFDPNPEFAALRLGTVRRLTWRNDQGFEAWGDLVLPPGHVPGTRLPLVVVQYRSDGFLRGGTNDEYPIQAFAAQGIAVLSIERPAIWASRLPGLTSADELERANYRGWAERKSLLSSLLAGVDAAVATGAVDGKRVGITGLSDGATTVRFALINTRRFAAAALSTCCLEPKTVMTYGGIAWARFNRSMGFPGVLHDDPAFWKPMSLAQNARSIDTPLLMQLADEEYLLALEPFEALREAGKPVEMHVYPDEHHGKWQPAHRLAVYQRNLDWFGYWLQERRDPDPAKQAQYTRWDRLRAARDGARPPEPRPRHRPGA